MGGGLFAIIKKKLSDAVEIIKTFYVEDAEEAHKNC